MADSLTIRAVHVREHPRYEVSIPVDCTTRHLFVSNQVCNIARGGLFIRSETPLPLQAEVSLVLHLPGTEQCIRATGRVIWNYDMRKGTVHIVVGSGIRFTDMPRSDRALLEKYLAGLTPSRPATH